MSRSMRSVWKVFPQRAERGERGFTLLEFVSALAISVLGLASIHLTMGTALLGRVLTSSTVHKQHEGRQVVEWIADRVRQAGFVTPSTAVPPTCSATLFTLPTNGQSLTLQDMIAIQSPYKPTASQLWINGDIGDGTGLVTRGFRVESISGVPTVTETVVPCPNAGGPPTGQPLTSRTSVQVIGLTFGYYDVNGNAVTNLTQTASIRTIRLVTIAVQVRANAKQGPTDETWTTSVALRNP